MPSIAASIAACAFSLAFLILATRDHLARGGPMRPRTFASNSTNDPARAEREVLLYQLVAKAVPRNATITVLRPTNRDSDENLSRVAHGQLPFQRVVPQATLTTSEAPDFVLTFGSALDDARYERQYESPAGALWKRTRW
jgi:hypothetical protein